MKEYLVTFSEGHNSTRGHVDFRVKATDRNDAYEQARTKLEKFYAPIKGSPYYFIKEV